MTKGIILKCYICDKEFRVKPSRKISRNCCSRKCHGIKLSHEYSGRKLTEEWKEKIGNAHKGEKHRLWKGDEVGYKSLHQWVNRELGIATRCSECESVENVEWANRSHKYKRDINDWVELCKKCHRNFDKLTKGKTKTIFKVGLGGFGTKYV